MDTKVKNRPIADFTDILSLKNNIPAIEDIITEPPLEKILTFTRDVSCNA